MSLVVYDIGGSSVKYGVWDHDKLTEKGAFSTPVTWDEMKEALWNVKDAATKKFPVSGVAISAPGAVNQERGVIEGASAVPYLHNFPILTDLTDRLECPIAIENDANCAALAEIWKGAAKGLKNVIFVVIGSGIGGAVIVDGKIHHGKHLFGGEFGYMLLTKDETFSTLATPVNMAYRYADRMHLPKEKVSGEKVFELGEEGDEVAGEEVDKFYRYLAQGIFNLQHCFDPQKIIIGGGISSKPDLLPQLRKRIKDIREKVNIVTLQPEIEICQFKNDANLIGAVYNYHLSHR